MVLSAGYGAPLAPNPECTLVNVIVMFQVITSSLIDYCCMGLVFARRVARQAAVRLARKLVATALLIHAHTPQHNTHTANKENCL
jgi:hypothetical protein